jgi:Leucine-rich repeat (LRR) protein
MDFSVSKNPSAVYTPEIITAELTRARDNGISDIDFSTKTIEEMPDLLGMVTKLSRLVLTDCKIKILPKDRLTGLTTLRYIDLTANSLKNFPRCFSLPSVQQLLLDHNQISKVQDEDLGYLTDLHVLTMFGNQLKTFPSIITTMKSMIKLDLECNHIKTLEFDESYFPPSFQLSIDFTVKTPSSSGTRNTPASAKRATAKRGVTSPSKAGGMFGGRLTAADIAAATGASPSSASSSSSSSGKGRLQSPNATSSTASNGKLRSPTKKVTSPTAGNRKKRKSMTDVDLGFTPAPVAQTEREGSEDETSPSKPKSKKPKLR